MDSFIASLLPASVALIILLLLVGCVAFLLSASKTKKQKAFFEQLHTQLAPGKHVMFCGGIFGEVVAVGVDEVEVKIAPKTTITVSRYAIQAIVEKADKQTKEK